MELKHIKTTEGFAEFERRFAEFMKREGLNNLSSSDAECVESYFSHSPCDCCQRPLGGDRYDCSGFNPTTKEVQADYSICVDCYYYAEYGTLDDTTMQDPKGSAPAQLETKHTPGPWQAKQDHMYTYPVEDTEGNPVLFIDKYAAITTINRSVDEIQANALIVAAAPELLDALLYIVNWKPVPGAWSPETARDQARAAIKKATGQDLPEWQENTAIPLEKPEEAKEELSTDRQDVIRYIRANLRKRSGKAWSVTGSTGTAWGWLTIQAPPARRVGEFDYTSDEECAELKELLGLNVVGRQGVSIAASADHYLEYMDRAAGRVPSVIAERYWD